MGHSINWEIVGNSAAAGFLHGSNQGYQNANHVPVTSEDINGTREGSDYVTGQSGTKYSLPRNDRVAQLLTNLSTTADTFIKTGDEQGSILAGAAAVQDLDNVHWRTSNLAQQLDSQGYDPLGIQSFLKSGDKKELETGMGQMVVDVNGKPTRMTMPQYIDYTNAIKPQERKAPTVFGSDQSGRGYVDADGVYHQVQEAIPEHMTPYQQEEVRLRQEEINNKSAQEAAKIKAKEDKANQPVVMTVPQQLKAAGEFRQQVREPLVDYQKRVSSGNQISELARQHTAGNTWGDASMLANFMKTEAPSLGPRQSQITPMLEHNGTTWNGVQRSVNRAINGQQLTESDVKNIDILGQVQQYVAYKDLTDGYGAQRKALIDKEGVSEDFLPSFPKPKGYDQWHIGGDVSELQNVGTTKRPDGIYPKKGGGYIRVAGGKAYIAND